MQLSKDQKRVVTSEAPVLQVVAAAGSGKTRTMIHLVEETIRRGTNPERVLMLSFSRKACGEIRARLTPEIRGKVRVSTFHALAFQSILASARGRRVRILSEEKKKDFLQARLRHADTQGVPFGLLLSNKRMFRELFPGLCMDAYRALADLKRREGFLEFDDLVLQLNRSLRDGAMESLKRAFDVIIVDEFQDTDPGQLAFLQQMKPLRLIVVGDDYQSIYGFRGADPSIFLRFRRHFPGARILKLAHNYRSLPRVVQTGNQVISFSQEQVRKRVSPVRKGHLHCGAFPLRAGAESELAAMLASAPEARLLCRSNHRRAAWQRAGVHPSQIQTIHSSKGLEFPIVFLDAADGWTAARGRRVPDEEVRVAYVGLSRAENLLVVLYDPAAPQAPERAVFEMFRESVQRVALEGLSELLEASRGVS